MERESPGIYGETARRIKYLLLEDDSYGCFRAVQTSVTAV
jgi:hypothetical protein